MSLPVQFIVITGFMGSGKTTVATALAQQLACSMIDLDHFIIEREGHTPQAIIDELGEPAFRRAETRWLHEILENKLAGIIALGGGTWTIAENRRLIECHKGFTVWLDAPFELCWQRIASTGHERPLARQKERALSLFSARQPLYQLAQLRVQVNKEKNAAQLAAEIADALRG